MTVTVLPTYKGYTIDVRLKEFRRAVYGQILEFIPFDSPHGSQILDEMAKEAPELFRRVYGSGN
jgi:hypothetical protein